MDIEEYKSMSPEELRALNAKSGTLLLLDVPDGLEFGIDNIVWKTGNKFKGIKLIPMGAHIISYSLKDENHEFKINKFLFFDNFKGMQTQILIYKWCFKYSMFLELKGAQAQGYRQGVKNYHFDSYLGPYPLSNLEFWKENVNHVSRVVLEKLDPVEKIYAFEEEYQKVKEKKEEEVRIDIDEEQEEEVINEENQLDSDDDQHKAQIKPPIDLKQPQENIIPEPAPPNPWINKKFQALSDTIYYSQIPRILSHDPSHISKVNLNKTQVLLQVVSKEWLSSNQVKDSKIDDAHLFAILGEIQYAFIYFLIGQDQDSLEQWKKLINLIVFSEDLFETPQMVQLKKDELAKGNSSVSKLIDSFEKLSLEFIVVLYNQISQFPADFFIDELSKDSFMENCLKRLAEYKDENQGAISKKVKKRLEKLFKLLSNKFNYEAKIQEVEECDEDAPIIVEGSQSYF